MEKRDRRTYIGSSDIAAILNLSRYRSPYDVYMSKVFGETQADNEPMFWGRRLESTIIEVSCTRRGWTLVGSDIFSTHDEYDFLGATADAIITEDEILEAKNTIFMNKSFTETDVSDEYVIQAQWLMGIHKKKMCHFCVLIGGNELKHYKYVFDEVMFLNMIKHALNFWEYVKQEIPPAVTRTSDYRYASIEKDSKEADENVLHAIEQYEDTCKSLKILNDTKDKLSDKIKIYMGTTGFLTHNHNAVCKLTPGERESWDSDALRTHLGADCDKFLKKTKYATLKIVR